MNQHPTPSVSPSLSTMDFSDMGEIAFDWADLASNAPIVMKISDAATNTMIIDHVDVNIQAHTTGTSVSTNVGPVSSGLVEPPPGEVSYEDMLNHLEGSPSMSAGQLTASLCRIPKENFSRGDKLRIAGIYTAMMLARRSLAQAMCARAIHLRDAPKEDKVAEEAEVTAWLTEQANVEISVTDCRRRIKFGETLSESGLVQDTLQTLAIIMPTPPASAAVDLDEPIVLD